MVGIGNERKHILAENNGALTVVGIFLCIILIPILFFNTLLIIKGYSNPDEVPGIKGYKPMMVLTDSMYPTIKSGDLIIIKEIDPNLLEIGDIITFYDPAGNGQTTVTHTINNIIIENEKLMFETKGDNNNTPDRLLVESEAVIGVYVFRIPIVAKVAMYLQTLPGLILCIFLPLGIIILYNLIRRRRYEEMQEIENQEMMLELMALRSEIDENL